MQTSNPFELIISMLDQLQSTVNTLSEKAQSPAKSAADQDRLLDLTEAAQIVRKPVGTVRHYIHHRQLPATKIGKSYLVRFSELLNWVEQFNSNEKPKADPLSAMMENRKRYKKS